MENTEKSRKKYIGYEYKEVIADCSNVSFLLDGYECFGWKQDENVAGKRNLYAVQHSSKMVLHLKRDRKIVNKIELTRLQRNFEDCLRQIDMLENEKSSKATMYALIIGVIGTAFMAGSVFAVTAQPPQILLCIILAIPAFIGWILPYPVYTKVLRRQTEKVLPLIEEKYDEIYEICKKGNKLLY